SSGDCAGPMLRPRPLMPVVAAGAVVAETQAVPPGPSRPTRILPRRPMRQLKAAAVADAAAMPAAVAYRSWFAAAAAATAAARARPTHSPANNLLLHLQMLPAADAAQA